jgi:hypothetical protein
MGVGGPTRIWLMPAGEMLLTSVASLYVSNRQKVKAA